MSIYHKDVTHLKTLDPYRLQELYQMHPCAEHVVKKLLVAGERSGGKSLDEDIADAIWTLKRWQEMRAEDAALKFEVVDTTSNDDSTPVFEAVHGSAMPAGPAWRNSPRYDWSTAPEWARYAATDASGFAYWYAEKPAQAYKQWTPTRATGGTIQHLKIGRTDQRDNWTQTLEARPV